MNLLKSYFFDKIVTPSLKQGMKTAVWLLKLTIPVSFGVFLLDHFGILQMLANFTEPFFSLLGLTGKASIILITSWFTNIYSVIAVMATLDISVREGLILATMCLIAHSLIVETGIQRKTGSSAVRMVLIRLISGFVAAGLLNWVLPEFTGKIETGTVMGQTGFWQAFISWLKAISVRSLKIVILVNLLLILQRLLSELGILKWLERPFYPFLRIMGLPQQTSFLWLVANTLGLSYGSAIMISESAEGHLTREDADLLNHHIAVSHSQFEDTLLFAAMGFSIPWLIFPRFLLAVVVVWLRRFELSAMKYRTKRLSELGD
jgi:spore maturation protein SpmB